ncbi:type II toxin-antitoxin system HicB family antitoxin [bacterium]|nr:type II toxin-antitoxin system HicB family antitoxin [Bacteroidales bacterium]MCK5685143.1 type II toxin-antitoxin system HicB family antitoxin [bacterium]
MNYHFKVHDDPDGFWAQGIELEHCITQGDTKEELLKNLDEVLNLYLDEPADSKMVFPLPEKSIKGKDIVEILVNSKIAFALYLRQTRLLNKMTQKQVATKMGMKSVFGYQKLESSKTANPTLVTLSKLKKIFPKFNIALII